VFENRVFRIFEPGGGGRWQEAGEDCIMRGFITYQVKEDEVGGACRTNRIDEKCIKSIGG
jgi:hypothetical protein